MHSRIAAYCAIAALSSVTASSYAKCLSHPAQGVAQTVSFGVVSVPSDAPPNTVLAVKDSAPWSSAQFTCKKPTRTSSLGIFTTASALGEGIYDTNIPGIGIRISLYYNGYGYLRVPESTYINWTLKLSLENAHFKVELIKTGPVGDGGALQPGGLASGGYDGHNQVSIALLDARVEPQRPTCAFLSRQVIFTLGRVDGGVLAREGHSHWATQDLVSTGCSHATQMLMTFAGAADEADPSLFKLNGPDAATGVAVEVRSDHQDTQAIPNSALPLVLPASPEGRSYGFRARYRSTGRQLAPGPANTSITVNVAYR